MLETCTFIERCLSKMYCCSDHLSTAYKVLLVPSPRKELDAFFCFLQFLSGSIAKCCSSLTSGIGLFYREKSLCGYICAGVAQFVSVKVGGVGRMQWRDARCRAVATAGLFSLLNQICIRNQCHLPVQICQVLQLCSSECIF